MLIKEEKNRENVELTQLAFYYRGEDGPANRVTRVWRWRDLQARFIDRSAGGRGRQPSVAAVHDVRVPAGRPDVAEHEEHQGDHHGQQEPLGVQPAAGVASAVVVAAVAPHAEARSRPHGGAPLLCGSPLRVSERTRRDRIASSVEKGGKWFAWDAKGWGAYTTDFVYYHP